MVRWLLWAAVALVSAPGRWAQDPRDGPDSMVVHLVSASDQEEQVAFRAQMHTDSVQNADDANSLPRNVRLTFHMDGIPVTLNLTLNPRVDTRPPVYIGRNGTITRVDLEGTKNFGLYYDKSHAASITMTSDIGVDGHKHYLYSGTFRTQRGDFELRPAEAGHGRRRRRRRGAEGEEGDHLVYTMRDDGMENGDYDDVLDRMNLSSHLGNSDRAFYTADLLGPHNYGVQMMLATDYGSFQRWREVSEDLSTRVTENDIINNIVYYYTHIVNGIDLRLMSIRHSRMAFYARLAGFYIAVTPDASPFTQRFLVYEPPDTLGYTEAYDGLDAFQDWRKENRDRLPQHDHATLYTGYSLYTGRRPDGRIRTIYGLGDIKGICSDRSATICVDWNQNQATQTGAHELGHSLGAVHDGTGNSCDSTDQYIMAVSPGVLNDDIYDNVFKFSTCSRDDIARHMDMMLIEEKNCLMDGAEWWDPAAAPGLLSHLPGQLLDWHAQCRYSFGPLSYYCSGQLNDELMCERLVCYNPLRGKCTSSVEVRAADGTTCQNNQWCHRGRCVFDQAAPQSATYCLTGDLRGEFEHSAGKSCESIRYETPHDCYLALFREPCCHTCELLRNQDLPDCPYGDRHQYCKGVQASECYAENTQQTCCAFCAAVRQDVEGCEYGDRAAWCRTSNPGYVCYKQADICCQRCEETRDRNNPDCPWGNEASWCNRLEPDRCYFPEDRRKCCGRCQSFRTNIQGCEYGDRFSDCSGRDCSMTYYQRHCCYTCRREAARPTYPPSTLPASTTTDAEETDPPTTTTTSTAATSPSSTLPPPEDHPEIEEESPRECIVPGVDSAGWCIRIQPHNCYKDDDVCCETCPQFATGIEGCIYGDRVSWCRTIFPGQCYDEDIQFKCCHSCPRLLRNVEGCEYGDRYSWCTSVEAERCVEVEMRASCCTTCMTSAPPTTTTTPASVVPETTQPTTQMAPIDCAIPDNAGWCQEDKFRAICYSDPAICCETCRRRWTGVTECPYGDRVSWCPELEMASCATDEYYRHQCCQTCATGILNTQPPTDGEVTTPVVSPEDDTFCQSPDVGSWCSSLNPYECYSSADMCCQTCLLHYTSIEGCEFGDRHESCRGLRAQSCYFPQYPSICCATCAGFATGLQGCEYGDQLEDCRAANCTDPVVSRICCHTCSQHENRLNWQFIDLPPATECLNTDTWCGTIPPEDCYTENHICCRTCLQYFTGIKDCEYQDRVSWCTSAIHTEDDCKDPAIRTACCFTCGMFHLIVEEDIAALQEGAILRIEDSSLAEVLSREPLLLNVLRQTLTVYCQVHAGECCSLLSITGNSVPSPSGRTGESPTLILRDGDVVIPEGYPQQLTEREIVLKVLVTLTASQIEPLCGTRGRNRRSAGGPITIYFDRALLSKIINNSTDLISKRTQLRILDVSVQEETDEYVYNISSSPVNRWLMLLTGLIIVAAIATIVCIIGKRALATKRGRVRRANSVDSERALSVSSSGTQSSDVADSDHQGHTNLAFVNPGHHREKPNGNTHPMNDRSRHGGDQQAPVCS